MSPYTGASDASLPARVKALSVVAGSYSVRIAPVGDEIGILSFAIGVEVA